MANYKLAFQITIYGNEGGYNQGIGEHETYMGIDRGANPHWSGWAVIDNYKKRFPGISVKQMNAMLKGNSPLQLDIFNFFKANYWDTVKLDLVNDQQLANNLFDCSVNQGEGLARHIMQKACNYVIAANHNALPYLVLDGKPGPRTLATFNSLPPAVLNAEINAERDASYRQDSGFKVWGKVWESRLLKYAA